MHTKVHLVLYTLLMVLITILLFDTNANATAKGVKPTVVTTNRFYFLETSYGPVQMDQLKCLAKNIYFEAGNQSYAGKMMVGLVTMERLNNEHYPDTICKVVYQAVRVDGVAVHNKCQFSWTCDGKKHEVDLRNPMDLSAWKTSISIATMLIQNRNSITDDRLTHYHTFAVNPNWSHSKRLEPVMKVGQHLFYRSVDLASR